MRMATAGRYRRLSQVFGGDEVAGGGAKEAEGAAINAECSRAGPKAIENKRGGTPALAGTTGSALQITVGETASRGWERQMKVTVPLVAHSW